MKVLHLCTKVPIPANDGGSLAIMSFAEALQKAGHQVTILAANTPKHYQGSITELYRGIELKAVPVNTRISWFRAAFNLFFGTVPFNIARFKSKAFGAALRQMLQINKFDIVQLEGPHLGIYLQVIRQYSSARVVLRAHNVEHMLWNDIKEETFTVVKKIFLQQMVNRLRKFEFELASKVDGVLAITGKDLRFFQEATGAPVCDVIPFGIDIADYKVSGQPFPDSIFFIGALDWLPNQSGLCWFLDNVWPLLRSRFPQVTFHVSGRNAPTFLKARLKAENVYFYGEVPNAKVFMEEYQIQIVPLFSGSGVRVKIIEGMALGKPIVTTSKGVEGIEVTDGKHLLIADNPEGFLNKIGELINDKLKQNFLGENSRAFISKEFDNFALAKRIEIFYQKIALV